MSRLCILSLRLANHTKSLQTTTHLTELIFFSIYFYTIPNTTQDKQFENQLKTEYPDASRATILECDDENCVQVQCELQPNGEWKCEDGLEGKEGTSKTVLMTSENDD